MLSAQRRLYNGHDYHLQVCREDQWSSNGEYVNVGKNKQKIDICTDHQAIRRAGKCIKPNGSWMTMVRTMSGGENQRERWHGNV